MLSSLAPHERIIFAWDKRTFTEQDAQRLRPLLPHIGMVKVGPIASTAFTLPGAVCGGVFEALVGFLIAEKKRWMYDLKLHDTASTACSVIGNLLQFPYLQIFTYHANVRENTVAAILRATQGTELLAAGVTILTDHDPGEAAAVHNRSFEGALFAAAERIAEAQVKEAGARAGIVCSALDLPLFRASNGLYGDFSEFVAITPGIRLESDRLGGQSRVCTPREAARLGSDYLVVGESISSAQDWVVAAKRIAEGISLGLAER